ncbi:MAG: HMA2 domain-containing protein [Microcystaceae cyanobacterium]
MTTNLSANSTPVDQTIDELELKIADFLREHQEIEMVVPVALGLLVTSRLGLRGANALLANLVIASVSRQIFQQVKKTGFKIPEQTKENQENNHTFETVSSSDIPENQLIEGCSIVHSVPGRIRLKIKKLSEDGLYAKRLERLLKADDLVLSARVNRAAASVAINYEGNGISEMELGLRLLGILNQANSEEGVNNGA